MTQHEKTGFLDFLLRKKFEYTINRDVLFCAFDVIDLCLQCPDKRQFTRKKTF
jgi:hypothetical protein